MAADKIKISRRAANLEALRALNVRQRLLTKSATRDVRPLCAVHSLRRMRCAITQGKSRVFFHDSCHIPRKQTWQPQVCLLDVNLFGHFPLVDLLCTMSLSFAQAVLQLRSVCGARGAIGDTTRIDGLDGAVEETFVGSIETPQRINVDTDFPERNFPFAVSRDSHAVTGQRSIAFDASTFAGSAEARIPPGRPVNRMLVRLPALATNRHDSESGINRRALESEIHRDHRRQHFCFMLMFDLEIENVIVSQNPNVVLSSADNNGVAWKIAARATEGHDNHHENLAVGNRDLLHVTGNDESGDDVE